MRPGSYYERPTSSNVGSSVDAPLWIWAETPGTVTVSGGRVEAAEGATTWVSEGAGIYSANHDEEPLFGYSEDGVFLFRFNNRSGLANTNSGGVKTPGYGFASQGAKYISNYLTVPT